MKRSGPIARRKPLERGKALRRASIVAAVHAASVAPRRRTKTRAGEFTAKQRRVIYDRFEGRCACCGDWINPRAYVVQHRRARGQGGSRDPIACSLPNGVAMRPACHEYVEAHPTRALTAGFRIPQYQHPRDWSIRLWTGERVYLTDDGAYRKCADRDSR